ncbi:phosphoketolase family protein, partial [Enterococcus faecium]
PRPVIMPLWKKNTMQFEKPGSVKPEEMTERGKFVRENIEKNPENFRIFGPDETKTNRLNQVFKTTNRHWLEKIDPQNH